MTDETFRLMHEAEILHKRIKELMENTKFQDEFSKEIWQSTYKDHSDENVDDTFRRVATYVASVEPSFELQLEWQQKFYDALTDFKITAGGRIYSNAGTEWAKKGTGLLNCYVAPRKNKDIDSLNNILDTVKDQSNTLKSEGGWGENFSYIRPRGGFIHGVGVETPGAVKYMEIFDKTSDVITSGSGRKSKNKKAKGKIRKGAMMGVLDCLSGNTLIDTIDGKIAIKDLVGKNPYLYCTDGNGNIFVRQAQLVWSKGIRKTIKITMDGHETLECTPEHEIMLSNGSYKMAKDLTTGDSLSVLNRKMYNKQYIYLGVSGNRIKIAEHHATYEMKYGEYPTCTGKKRKGWMTLAHHKDECKWNNHPDNIEKMTLSDHAKLHDNILRENQKRISKERKGKSWDEYYGKELADRIKKSSNFNHKVVKIETHIEQEVFDIAMPEYHNFVANGVFVHNCWHPDIFEFITAKQNAGRLTKFNMSVNCTNEFMARVIEIEDNGCDEFDTIDIWDLKFPDTTYSKYSDEWDGDLELWESKGYPTIIHDTVSVKHLWNIIMESTYNRAEPGILWCDRANEFNPAYYIEKIRATNPCGEQFLAESGVCDLASYNLTQYIEEDSNGGHYFNFEKFEKYISVGVRFLDNVNTVSNSPLPEYKDSMLNKRRIGLGILGWGSLLFMLKIRFGSTDANTLRDKIMQTLATKSYEYSIDLAIEKGMFTYCDPIKHADGKFIQNLHLSQDYMDKLRTTGIRNSSLLSCQPTGNTSIFANIVSGGIEPVFMPEYIRTVIVNSMPEEISHVCPKWYEGEWNETDVFSFTKEGDEEILKGKMNGIMYKIDKNRGLTKEVLCEDYGVRWLKARGEYDPTADYIVTTTELTADDHLNDLKGFARWVDSALSKTINLPNDYSFEDFKNVYLDTYKTGYIKGITTYRAGTMTTVLSSVDDQIKEEEIILDDVKMPDSASATIKTIKAEGKKWYLTIVYHTDSDKPFALFVKTNSNEKTVNANNAIEVLTKLAYKKGIPEQHIETTISKINQDSNASKITRIISLMLRHGVLIKNIVLALDTIEDVYVGSFLFQIKKFLSSYVKDGEKVEGAKCENCGSDKIEFSEGCFKCVECGSSKCG